MQTITTGIALALASFGFTAFFATGAAQAAPAGDAGNAQIAGFVVGFAGR